MAYALFSISIDVPSLYQMTCYPSIGVNHRGVREKPDPPTPGVFRRGEGVEHAILVSPPPQGLPFKYHT